MGQAARVLNETEKTEVETLAAVLSTEQIADFLGMGRRTFYTLMQHDDDLAARYKRGRARAVGAVAQSLIAKARAGNIVAMIFYLKTQGGWRETMGIEHRHEADATLAMIDVSTLSDAALTELDQAMKAMIAQQPVLEGTVDRIGGASKHGG